MESDLVNIQFRKVPMERIPIKKGYEIFELAKKLDISLNSEAIQNIIGLGMKSLHSEKQLEHTIKKLEKKKEQLESNFQKIALQGIKLESKYVGTRNQIVKVYRDNRALTMHLCTYSPRNEHERRVRERLIQKYIIDAKLM